MVDLQTRFSSPKRYHVNHQINRKPASNFLHAVHIAREKGTPLNTFVTIDLFKSSCPPEKAGDCFKKLRDRYYRPWLRPSRKLKTRRDRDPCAYVWVFENPGGNLLNLHWLLHVEADRKADFEKRLREDWLPNVGVVVEERAAVDVRTAGTPEGLVYYLLKGIDPFYARFYHVWVCKPQGPIIGRRSDFSRSLGPAVKRQMREEGRYQSSRLRSFPVTHSAA